MIYRKYAHIYLNYKLMFNGVVFHAVGKVEIVLHHALHPRKVSARFTVSFIMLTKDRKRQRVLHVWTWGRGLLGSVVALIHLLCGALRRTFHSNTV